MRVGILLLTANRSDKKKLMLDFVKGIKKSENKHKIILHKTKTPLKCDVALIFSFFNKFTKEQNLRKKIYKLTKCPNWLILDNDPFVYKEMSKKNTINFENYYFRICLNSPYYNEGCFMNQNCPSDRWNLISKEKNIILKPWRETGNHILLLLQSTNKYSIRNCNFNKWINNTISIIRKYSNRPIIIRRKKNEKLKLKIKDPINKISYTNNPLIENDLKNCWAAICYNTSACVPCIIEGIPVFVGHPSAITYQVSNTDFTKIENPLMPERQQFLNDLCYSCWSLKEFRNGTIWNRFESYITKNQ